MKTHPKGLATTPVLLALALPTSARAAGGTYDFDAGTQNERAQVTAALNASSFDWNAVPARIRIHIVRGTRSHAIPGEIWIDADLLDTGRFSWGVVQHEYAHQVDFLMLADTDRMQLSTLLGGKAWWNPLGVTLAHSQLAGERFASTLAWSYRPSPENSMRPQGPGDESAAMEPARFRTLMQRILNLPVSTSTTPAVKQDAPPTKVPTRPTAHSNLATLTRTDPSRVAHGRRKR
jgi:hypothetical protein